METQDLEKALDIVSKLLIGEEVSQKNKETAALYEAYVTSNEVYDNVQTILKRLNISIYEYKDALYITAGEKNRIFGYTNEELKKAIGIKLNKELYLCYFIIYHMVSKFYTDSAGYTFAEYVRVEDVIGSVDESLKGVIRNMEILSLNEVEENSFRQLAMLWEDLPAATVEDVKAARNSKAGYVKLVFNFMVGQKLFVESEDRYYPKDRLRALVEDYFEEYQGRLHEIMSTKEDGIQQEEDKEVEGYAAY